MKKALNLKNMKEIIVNYPGDQKEFDKIWDSFYEMAVIGFIDPDTWKKFYNQCRGWYIDDKLYAVRDDRTGDIIWSYNSKSDYKV